MSAGPQEAGPQENQELFIPRQLIQFQNIQVVSFDPGLNHDSQQCGKQDQLYDCYSQPVCADRILVDKNKWNKVSNFYKQSWEIIRWRLQSNNEVFSEQVQKLIKKQQGQANSYKKVFDLYDKYPQLQKSMQIIFEERHLYQDQYISQNSEKYICDAIQKLYKSHRQRVKPKIQKCNLKIYKIPSE